MSRRRLLSPLSLDRWYLRVVLFLSLGAPLLWIVPQTGANATLKVDEPKIKILLARDPVEVLLPVENLSRNIIDARIHLELLDPSNAVVAEAQRTESIQQTATISIPLPFFVSKLKTKERNQLPW